MRLTLLPPPLLRTSPSSVWLQMGIQTRRVCQQWCQRWGDSRSSVPPQSESVAFLWGEWCPTCPLLSQTHAALCCQLCPRGIPCPHGLVIRSPLCASKQPDGVLGLQDLAPMPIPLAGISRGCWWEGNCQTKHPYVHHRSSKGQVWAPLPGETSDSWARQHRGDSHFRESRLTHCSWLQWVGKGGRKRGCERRRASTPAPSGPAPWQEAHTKRPSPGITQTLQGHCHLGRSWESCGNRCCEN